MPLKTGVDDLNLTFIYHNEQPPSNPPLTAIKKPFNNHYCLNFPAIIKDLRTEINRNH